MNRRSFLRNMIGGVTATAIAPLVVTHQLTETEEKKEKKQVAESEPVYVNGQGFVGIATGKTSAGENGEILVEVQADGFGGIKHGDPIFYKRSDK